MTCLGIFSDKAGHYQNLIVTVNRDQDLSQASKGPS